MAQGAAMHTSHLSSLGVNPPPGASGEIPGLGGQGWCWLCRAIPCHSHCRASPRELCPLPPGALGAAPAIPAGCEGLEAARGAQPAPAGEHFGHSWYPGYPSSLCTDSQQRGVPVCCTAGAERGHGAVPSVLLAVLGAGSGRAGVSHPP